MKRLLVFLIAMSIILPSFPALSFAEDLSNVTFYNNATGTPIKSLDEASDVYAEVTFDATSDSSTLVAAHYDYSGVLTKTEFINPISSVSGQNVTYTTPSFSVKNSDVVKIFAWDGLNSMKPLLQTPGVIAKSVPLPTATINTLDTSLISVPLTFAMNFKADTATDEQLIVYGDWYSDFVLTVNKDVKYNANGTADAYLAGQYDSWSSSWLAVPNKTYEVKADNPIKIMESAAAIYGEPGLKYTYREVYERVKNFNCGVFFNKEFLAKNSDLKATLELRIYNPKNANESYRIGESYQFTLPNAPVDSTILTAGNVTAVVPSSAILENGTQGLKLTTKSLADSQSGISADENEKLTSYDIHIEGVSEDNNTPIIITLPEAADKGLNKGNLSLYHVENGETVSMEEVESEEDLVKHNQFTYEPLDGTITLAMATFSEVALLSETEKEWEGNYDYSWYTNAVVPSAEESITDYTISNADQLAAFGQIVGGMSGDINRDSFSGKTVTLTADINLGDTEKENNPEIIFYPIGYYNSLKDYKKVSDEVISSNVSSFEGTFDGAGHTISNFYQNTWEMFGDYNEGYSGTPNHYKDAMGLFGYVKDGTVKNLTVDHFSSDGEFTPTGVIAAYAVNSTFENIAITNCNPRVYNTGNGGIVGIGGNSSDTSSEGDDTYAKLAFNNITVDNSNKISALWGSWDVACGGLMGMFRGNGLVEFTNCHVAAQIDVYNDVCANYQYYAYRYAGMMIGSIRKNETIDGHVYPDMDGITASGCTVHFGNWKDYYYCELVANSLASYTHDHQFSRLTQVDSVNINDKTITVNGEIRDIPTSGRVNYVVVDENGHATENATCYHFVDGEVWNHADAGTETVNSETVLKEDKQHIYLPFNQLFTGYGWGVTSKGLTDFDGVKIDIKTGEYEESVKKFSAKVQNGTYTTGTTVTVGELFEAIASSGVDIKKENVQVTVSPVDDSDVTATYNANETDWKNGTLTFSGTGAATVTITDYYFCTPTTIEVTITKKPEPVEKFDKKFNNENFLYRVGNEGNVALGSLFKAKNNATIGTVSVTVETVSATATATPSSLSYTKDKWAAGEINFDKTGVVKVTIKDDDAYCIPTVLYLEVVDAVNATTATSATSNSVVLLNNVTNGSFSVSAGHAFYGNGFTVTLNPSSHTTKRSAGFDGYVHMNGGTLDNVIIEGPVFPAANIYRVQGETGTASDDPVNYFRNALIIDSGDCIISNSHISGTRAAIYVKNGGDVVIDNTTVSGGAYANVEVSVADSVTFKDVTTVQQSTKDSYNQNKQMIGLGIVVDDEETDVYIEGTLNQYNWLNQEQWKAMLGSYVEQFPKLFSDAAYEKYWHYRENDGTTNYVNLTLIYACEWNEKKQYDNRTDKILNYVPEKVTINNMNGGVYSVTNAGTLVDAIYKYPGYASNATYPVAPESTFDYKEKNYEQYVDGSDTYCYEDSGVVKIGFLKGNSKVWDTSILTATKLGNELSYTVSMNGTDYTGKSITFTEGGNYEVIYTYTDPYNYKLENGVIVSYSKEYKEIVNITVNVTEEQAKNAEFKMGKESKDIEKIQIGEQTYLSATGVDASTLTTSGSINFPNSDGDKSTISFKYNSNKTWGSADINGHTFYFPIVSMGTTDNKWSHTGSWYGCFPVFEGTFTITDYADGGTGTETIYNSSTTTMPTNLEALYPQTVFRYQGTQSKVPTTPSKMTKGTYANKLCYTTQTDLSASNERSEEWNLATYTYTDNKGATYYWYVGYYCAASTNGGCFTSDTLITMADGSKKMIKDITFGEKILAWDFFTGEYVEKDIALLVNHGEDLYKIANMELSDGSVLKIIAEHGIFDYDLNKYVYISAENVSDYIGHRFVKYNADGSYDIVRMTKGYVTEEYTGSYSITSADTSNAFASSLLTVAPPDDFYNWIEMGDKLRYDTDKFASDVEKYGLYTYDDFKDYVTYEQFVDWNGAYLKIPVEKGLFTFEYILELIELYSSYMPE